MRSGLAWIKKNWKDPKDEETVDLDIVTIEITGNKATLALEGSDLQAVASRAGMRTIAKIIEDEMPELADKIVTSMHELDEAAMKTSGN